MRGAFTDILEKFACDTALKPYDSMMWQVSDAGTTCTAEIRCNAYADSFEVELQMDGDGAIAQVLWAEAKQQHGGSWAVMAARFKNEDFVNNRYAWDEKLAAFFRACVRELKAGRMPDLEAIEDETMSDGERFSSRRGDGSGRNVKVKTSSLLYDMKKMGGRGF